MRSWVTWLGVALVLLGGGCRDTPSSREDPPPGKTAQVRDAIIHGVSGRQDVFQVADNTLRERAMRSSVALVHANALDARDPENIQFLARSVWDVHRLCDPPYSTTRDLAPAFCSGTLIDDALVLTAGHCVPTAEACAQTRLVFTFYRADYYGLAPRTHEDVFQCQDVVVRARGQVAGRDLDYAILRLDRPATPRFASAPLRAGARPMAAREPVAVIGTSGGTALTLDASGTVLSARAEVRDYFVVDADMAVGSAGAGVYELRGHGLAGVLARGELDHVLAPGRDCWTERVCTGPVGCRGQDVTYVRPALEAYCQAESNPRLCPPPEATPSPEAQDFTATGTGSARHDTFNYTVRFTAGDRVLLGTCGVPLASAHGDTSLRLMSPSGTELAFNDDACDSRGSQVEFFATETGDYEVRAGCHGEESCGGTVAWSKSSAHGSRDYSASDTNSASRNTVNWTLRLFAGQHLVLGTCGVPGARDWGGAVLRLEGPSGSEVSSSYTCSSPGSGGNLTYTVPPEGGGEYRVRAGCFGSASCGGTAAWRIQ
ncbi:trypsin-like serine peptidase [Archangium primigenium]|uniref:trypsin-like serine peptidase n=1 Tax=[Archangium] primigenium TaxID=2792470 RepID=UPI00195C52E0|nr:serine protease [Archangium primigenium]MBM7116849.1 trypsin-like peptidase domain-containing protein [Archangium primigenium]